MSVKLYMVVFYNRAVDGLRQRHSAIETIHDGQAERHSEIKEVHYVTGKSHY